MSEYTTPIHTTFQLQRTAIEGSQQAIEQGLEFQRRLNGAVLESFSSQEDVQARIVAMTRASLHSYLDVVEASLPGSTDAVVSIREAVDEQFDTIEEGQAEALEATETEWARGVETYDEFVMDYLAALDEEIEFLLEANADIEAQTVHALEQTERQFEQFQHQFEEQSERFQIQFEQQAEQFQQQFQEQFRQFQRQLGEIQTHVEEHERSSVEA